MAEKKYKLWAYPNSGNLVVQLLLEHLGLPYDHISLPDVDDETYAEFTRISPMRQVPVLVFPDGRVMTETAAIILQLADENPGAGLLPPVPKRGEAYRWLAFLLSNCYETTLRAEHPESYVDPATDDTIAAVKQAACKRIARLWSVLEENAFPGPGPYMLGSQEVGALDYYLWMFTNWAQEKVDVLAACPRVAGMFQLVKGGEAVKRVWAGHFPGEP
ncbi:hypothetical protein DFJ74DRAFT_694370 [Hyaloraphidium curvatum]|nr:hypothetical protein DFJ74DRAFT_694370 [Hyaloraphidium curvatum]